MKKLLATFWLGIWLYFGTFLAATPAFAAGNMAQTTDKVEALRDRNLTRVQQFLTSIPRDYYTVRQINKVKALGKEQQALLVDVREPKEYASGHIPGAINLPLRSLTDNLDQIPKTRPVILYCSTGYRTAMGVMALQMLGYDNVRGFPPSIEGWKKAGETLEK
ncbi:rhodanese-like domain-containing protein [Waterburya agarophytonicola K14]|uniref:Rhodanese-like domain-containing protein n=1 Tax=Waterburya agarophytonicola KI4 TaxID=2874699 RepID=A0A964FGK7_9CYAN|nr:rhodanese-like domain-containing protein [Waterburya agarophytonicola]MCC0178151.1 rhodanese-like domain-containing protein [Waterburya agarophytonicola KI4]